MNRSADLAWRHRPTGNLLAENAILLSQIVDEILLTAVQPASEGEDEELQGSERCLVTCSTTARLESGHRLCVEIQECHQAGQPVARILL